MNQNYKINLIRPHERVATLRIYGDVMDIQSLKEFEAWWSENYDRDDFEDVVFSEILNEYESNYIVTDDLNKAWSAWQAAKAQTVPEGFVLVPKEPTDKTIAHMTNTPIEVNLLCDHADTFLSEGEACIAYQAMIEAQEPAPLKLGDLVEPIDHRYTLASGCERYPYAYVVNTNPFQLMSEEGDMYWCCTVEAGGYKLIKSNDQLPEAVSLRMIREGLLSPVETQEPTHD